MNSKLLKKKQPGKKAGGPPPQLLQQQQNQAAKKVDDVDDEQSSSSSDCDPEFEHPDDAEDFEDYKPEGYHAVYIGEQFKEGRYRIEQKLGWGHFSTVWLAYDKDTDTQVALKVQKSKKSYQEAAIDELALLGDLRKNEKSEKWSEYVQAEQTKHPESKDFQVEETYCVKLLDNFIHFGSHGKHYCSTFEIMGPNLLDLIQHFDDKSRYMKLWLVKLIARQCLIGLVYMHDVCGVIHTDIKPENVMIQLNEELYHQFIEQIKLIEKKPFSMLFLKKLSQKASKQNAKKDKQKEKKKKKKQKANAAMAVAAGNDMQSAVSAVDKEGQQKNIVKEEEKDCILPTTTNTDVTTARVNQSTLEQLLESSKAQSLEQDQTTQEGKIEKQNKADFKNDDVANDGQNDKLVESVQDSNSQETVISSEQLMPQDKQQINEKQQSTKNDKHSGSSPSRSSKKVKKPSSQQRLGSAGSDEEKNNQEEKNIDENDSGYSDEESDSSSEEISEEQLYTLKWKKQIPVMLDKAMKIKLVDFGNACWVKKHFTNNIQTREYRAPEVIIGIDYEQNTDVFSLACMIYELLTNDYLFKPKKRTGTSKSDEHLALFQESLGKFKKDFALSGSRSREFFNKNGQLLRIKEIEDYPISKILIKEYDWDQQEAYEIEEFLLPMLNYNPKKRVQAREALEHPWLWS